MLFTPVALALPEPEAEDPSSQSPATEPKPLIDFSGCDLGALDVKGADFVALPFKMDADTKMDAVRNLPFAKFYAGSSADPIAAILADGPNADPPVPRCGTRGCRTGKPTESYRNAGHWNPAYGQWYAYWMDGSKAEADATHIRYVVLFICHLVFLPCS